MTASNLMFEPSSITDKIRQIYIDLDSDQNVEFVQNFLKETHIYFEKKDLPINLAKELFCTIEACFRTYPEYSFPFLDTSFKKTKINQYYYIITISIFYELTQVAPNLYIQDFQSLVYDSIKQILPQLHINKNHNIFIFDLLIPPQFQNSLLLNLFLLSDITDELFINFFPYILFHNMYSDDTKFDLIIQKLIKNGYLEIPSQTNEFNDILLDILKSKNIFICEFNKKALSFITACIYFAIKEGKIDLKFLTKENIYSFIAVTIIYMEKCQKKFKFFQSKVSDSLLLDSIKCINEGENLPVFNASIDIILSYFLDLDYNYNLISNDVLIEIILLLTTKLINNEFMANKMLLISILFHFLENGIDFMSNELKLFLQSNQNEIFNLIFNHLSEIINDFKCPKLNLAVFDQSLISDHICKLTKADDLFSTLYFIEKFCFNAQKMEFSQETINLLLQILHDKLKEQKYNDTLFIIKYIKKEMINEFNDVSMPDFIKNEMYNIKINEDIGIDELLNNALIKSNLGEIDELLKILFKKMKDKEIYENYICYKTIKQNESSFDDIKYLSSFYNEYQENPDLFKDIINKMFYYYKYSKKLELKWKFRLSSLPSPKYGIPIVSMLFKSNTFQSFVCLQRIASSFPFIFIENSQQIFDSVHPHFDHLSLIFETNLNDESLLKIKTAYSALSFLSSTLQSIFILDDFLNWLFSNILTFSNSQVICYIICFYGVYCASTKIQINALIQKYNFLKTLENLLERDFKGEQFSDFYKNYIYSLAEMIYLSLFKCNSKSILLIENYQNFEKPLYYVEDTLYRKSLKDPIIDSKYFEFFSKDVVRFMMNFNSNSDFWENIKDKYNSPSRSEADDILSKLFIIDKDLENSYSFPYEPFDYSVKMYKYFFFAISNNIFYIFKRSYFVINIRRL